MHDLACRDTYPNQHVGITVRALIYRWMDRDAAGVPQVLSSALDSLFFCQIGISASSPTVCCCLCSGWTFMFSSPAVTGCIGCCVLVQLLCSVSQPIKVNGLGEWYPACFLKHEHLDDKGCLLSQHHKCVEQHRTCIISLKTQARFGSSPNCAVTRTAAQPVQVALQTNSV